MAARGKSRLLKRSVVLLFVVVAGAMVLGQAPTTPTNATPATPTIASLSVSSGAVGATVVITGSGFAATQGSGTVTFAGTTATASSWSALSITVTVPRGASTGPVIVTQNGIASAGVTFTVTSGAITCSVTASNLTASEVQSRLNAAKTGQTICLPAGTQAWSTAVTWTAPANVKLIGAGSLSTLGGGDVTVITDNFSSVNPLLSITTRAGTFRMAGFTIRGGTASTVRNGSLIEIGGASTQVRIDHMTFDRRTYSTPNDSKLITIGGGLRGVADHNKIYLGRSLAWAFHFVNGTNDGDDDWAAPTGFGGSDFFFVEDSYVEGQKEIRQPNNLDIFVGQLTDCHTGGKWVARYNTFVAIGVGQTHPTGHAGHDRGCRAHEIYGNTITSPINTAAEEPNYAFDYNNSGGALVWGNSFDQVYKQIFYFNVTRWNGDPYNLPAPPTNWGRCGTEHNGVGSAWDRNDSAVIGYPCLDQPGRGQGDRLSGDFPREINDRTRTIAYPRQALEPIYEWLNTGTVVAGWGDGYAASIETGRIVQNRDYYLYRGNTSCNPNAASCTAGVGVGTLAERPANCTPGPGGADGTGGGVAWWATNTSTLYRCTATNTWSTYYTPYVYPHPLNVN